jgi:hypothetical protein
MSNKLTLMDLQQFTGTEQYHRWSPLFKNYAITDGVKYMCDKANAYWLIDAIASYYGDVIKDPMLADMQFWKLKVNPDKSAVLTCERDTDDVAITQKIPYTDFPLPEIKLWVAQGDEGYVIYLPSEH